MGVASRRMMEKKAGDNLTSVYLKCDMCHLHAGCSERNKR